MILFAFAQKKDLPNAKHLPAYVLEQQNNALFPIRQKVYGLLWQLTEQLLETRKKIFKENFLSIKKNDLGRPEIPAPQIDFNLSHSGEWVAAILFVDEEQKQKRKVAIDIEHHQDKNFSMLLKRFASDEEILWAENSAQKFYELWCVREALLKASGSGLRKLREVKCDPLNKKIFSPDNLEGEIYFFNQQYLSVAIFIEKNSAPKIEKIFHFSAKNFKEFHPKTIYQVLAKKDLDFD